MLRKQQ